MHAPHLSNTLVFMLHNVSLPITTYCTLLHCLEKKNEGGNKKKKGSLEVLTADIVLLNRTGLAFLQSVLWLSVSAVRG